MYFFLFDIAFLLLISRNIEHILILTGSVLACHKTYVVLYLPQKRTQRSFLFLSQSGVAFLASGWH